MSFAVDTSAWASTFHGSGIYRRILTELIAPQARLHASAHCLVYVAVKAGLYEAARDAYGEGIALLQGAQSPTLPLLYNNRCAANVVLQSHTIAKMSEDCPACARASGGVLVGAGLLRR